MQNLESVAQKMAELGAVQVSCNHISALPRLPPSHWWSFSHPPTPPWWSSVIIWMIPPPITIKLFCDISSKSAFKLWTLRGGERGGEPLFRAWVYIRLSNIDSLKSIFPYHWMKVLNMTLQWLSNSPLPPLWSSVIIWPTPPPFGDHMWSSGILPPSPSAAPYCLLAMFANGWRCGV